MNLAGIEQCVERFDNEVRETALKFQFETGAYDAYVNKLHTLNDRKAAASSLIKVALRYKSFYITYSFEYI